MKLNGKTDPLWHHVGLVVAQMDGLHAGAAYWAKSRQEKVRKPEMCVHASV